MKTKYQTYLALLLLMSFCGLQSLWADSITPPAKASWLCELSEISGFFPSYYCECLEDAAKFKLPSTLAVDGSQWYKTAFKTIKNGMTVYLYSDNDVTFDVYGDCSLFSPSYSYTIFNNQTRDIDSEKIKEKLAEMGMSGSVADNMAVYFRITGSGNGQLLCYPNNQGPESTCTNAYALLMSMTFVSSHANDVYELSVANMPTINGVEVHWTGDVNCTFSVSRGDCSAEPIIQAELLAEDSYRLPMELLDEVRATGESLYLRFAHASNTVGRIRLSEYVEPATPTASEQLHAPADKQQLVLRTDGVLYVIRNGIRYTILGNRF